MVNVSFLFLVKDECVFYGKIGIFITLAKRNAVPVSDIVFMEYLT